MLTKFQLFVGGKKPTSKGALGSIEIPEHLKLKSEDILSPESFGNFMMKNKEEIHQEAEKTMKDVHRLMKMYNFQPKKQSDKRDKKTLTVKDHIENSFWAFEQIRSMKDEIDKKVNSKMGTTQDERLFPEKG